VAEYDSVTLDGVEAFTWVDIAYMYLVDDDHQRRHDKLP